MINKFHFNTTICFGSIIQTNNTISNLLYFNTTICFGSISLFFNAKKTVTLFQYNYLFRFNSPNSKRKVCKYRISIQLFVSVQLTERLFILSLSTNFNTTICFGSMQLSSNALQLEYNFNTTICFGSISLFFRIIKTKKDFNTTICFGSINRNHLGTEILNISIQLFVSVQYQL